MLRCVKSMSAPQLLSLGHPLRHTTLSSPDSPVSSTLVDGGPIEAETTRVISDEG